MPWSEWEDYKAGLYAPTSSALAGAASLALLCDPDQFRETAREMLREWPNATVQNIRHMWSGRNAWIGQATCCYAHGATSLDTRDAWGQMSNDQQRAANLVAREVRDEWERGNHDAEALFVV